MDTNTKKDKAPPGLKNTVQKKKKLEKLLTKPKPVSRRLVVSHTGPPTGTEPRRHPRSSEPPRRQNVLPHVRTATQHVPPLPKKPSPSTSWDSLAKPLLKEVAQHLVPEVFGSGAGTFMNLASIVADATYEYWSHVNTNDELALLERPKAGVLSRNDFEIKIHALVESFMEKNDFNGRPSWHGIGPHALINRLYTVFTSGGWIKVVEFLDSFEKNFGNPKSANQLAHNDFGMLALPGQDATEPVPDRGTTSSTPPDPYRPDSDQQAYYARIRKQANERERLRASYQKSNSGISTWTDFGHMNPQSLIERGRPSGSGPPPIAYSESGQLKPQHPSIVGAVMTDFGPGIRVTGRQLLCEIKDSTTASTILDASLNSADIFLSTGVLAGPGLPGNILKLSPDYLNLRLATISQLYSRWRFVDAKILYTPACSTTTAGSFAIGFSEDVGIAAAVGTAAGMTFAATTQLSHSNLCQYWSPLEFDIRAGGDDEFLFTEVSETIGSPVAAERQTCHGLVSVFPSTTTGFATALGTLWITYDIILADPSPSYALATAYGLQKQIGESNAAIVMKYLMANPVLLAEILKDSGAFPARSDSQKLLTEGTLEQCLERLGLYNPGTTPGFERLSNLLQ